MIRHFTAANGIEALEMRQLLSAAAASAALLADGFTPITWRGEETFAMPGRWIAQVGHVHGKAQEQLSKVNRLLLSNGRANIRAVRHLGADGLVLLEAPVQLHYGRLRAALDGIGLRYIEPDLAAWMDATAPDDPSFSSQWGLNNTGQSSGTPDADIDAPEAWDLVQGDGSVVAAVIDTGVDYTHPDLAANIWTNPGEVAGNGLDDDGNGFVDDVHGWDFVNNDNDPTDDNGHGTHVAGTIAAAGNNALGVAGVSWNSKVMALKFIGTTTAPISGAVAALNYATMMRTAYGVNVRVSNNSWGHGFFVQALYDAVRRSGDAGILVVASAGNGGPDGVGDDADATPHYPATFDLDNIISVASTDRNDLLAASSNFGVNSVDLAAPGVSILSTTRGGGYGAWSGTSMAAPHVSGVAALAWSHSPAASLQTVRNAIFRGAESLAALAGKVGTGGRLNAYDTLLAVTTQSTTAPDAPTGLAAATVHSGRIDLAWSHPTDEEDGFRILRSTDGVNFQQVGTAGILAMRFSDTTPAAGTTYHYLVRAYNAAGESAGSNVASATTSPASSVPAAPTDLSAVAAAPTRVVLSWTDNSNNEAGFKVERSTNLVKWSQIATVSANAVRFTDTGVKRNTVYYYRVRAYHSSASSAYTNTATVTTPASAAGMEAAGATVKSLFSSTRIEPLEWEADELLHVQSASVL